jgi:phage-related protein
VALTSREVAEAYIDVHGDLSPFRKQLNKAGEDARKAGIANADKFSDGWKKRLESSMGDQWEALMDAMYSNDKVDWDRLIGKFDTKDLDSASEKIQLFIEQMRAGGKLTKKQYEEVTAEVRNVIKAKQQELFVQNDLNNAIHEHVDVVSEQVRVTTDWADVENKLTGVMEQHVDVLREEVAATHEARDASDDYNSVLWDQVGVTEEVNRKQYSFMAGLRQIVGFFKLSRGEGEKHNRVMSLMSGIADKVQKSWARMDSTVRMVLTLIGVSAGSMATLGSGLAGAGTALASSLAQSLGALVALSPAMVGFGAAIGLAVAGWDDMLVRLPAIQTAIDRIGDNWTMQATRFTTQWQGALNTLLSTFATQLGKYDFGTPLGKSFANITTAFTAILTGPGFGAFMTAMTTTIPVAVQGLGVGFAGVFGGLISLMAGAAPVAAQLGKDFASWGQGLQASLEKARQSGQITATFQQMRESLLHVLDLAGSLGMMLGTMFSLGAESGNRMLASLTVLVDKFTAWMNTEAGRAAMIQWFNNAETIMRSMGPLLVGLGQAMAILVTPETIAQFANLMSTVGQLLPILAQVLAVVSQLGILNILASLFLVVGQAVQPLLPPLMQIAGILGPLLQQAVLALAPLFNALVAAILPIVNAVLQVVGVVAPVLIPAITSIVAAITPVIAVIGELIGWIVGQLAPILGPFIAGVIGNFVGLVQGISNIIMGVVGIVRGIMAGDWVQIWNGAKQLVGGVVQAIANFIQLWIVGKAVALVRGGVTAILNFFKSGWTNISTTVSGAIGRVVSFVSSGMSRVGSAVSSWMSRVGSSISSAWNSAVSFVSGAMGRIGSAVSGGVGRVMGFIGSLPGRIVGALSGLGGRLSAMGSQMMAGFVGGIQSMAGRLVQAGLDAVGGAINAIKNFLNIGSPSRLMYDLAQMTWQGFINGGDNMQRPLAIASEGLAATVAAGFSHMYDEGRAAAEALAAGLTANKALVSGALDKLTPELTAAERRLTVGTGPGFAGTAPAPAGSQTVFQEGAIQFQTQVRDGKTAANQLLDVLARNAKVG